MRQKCSLARAKMMNEIGPNCSGPDLEEGLQNPSSTFGRRNDEKLHNICALIFYHGEDNLRTHEQTLSEDLRELLDPVCRKSLR